MRLVKLTTLRKFGLTTTTRCISVILLTGISYVTFAQDNSPYSRYGLGDPVPGTNVLNRGMGGVSAAYNDYFNINYNNPASYSFFQTSKEANSRKLSSGRVVLNVGVTSQFRTIVEPGAQKARFPSNNIMFSHVMLGMPLRKNWGLAFGIRPLNKIDYKISRSERILDPNSHLPIDTSLTTFQGDGGLYLASMGTGFKIKLSESQFLSFGTNGGYIFGKKDYSSIRYLFNDTTDYKNSIQQNNTHIGGLYFDAGMQYQFKLNKKIYVSMGAYGNWKQKIGAKKSYLAGLYDYNTTGGESIDTLAYQENAKGNILYPSSITAGVIIQKPQMPGDLGTGWLVGLDITRNGWNQYRYYGVVDTAVRSNWQAKLGVELRPSIKANYFSHVAYRFGFFTGPDYIYLRKKLPTYGITAGLGLPLANYNFAARYQVTMLDLGFEYMKRGNNDNLLKENLYRISVGFSLSDLWFMKRKYE